MSTYSSAMLFSKNQSNFNALKNASLLSYRSEVLKPYCWQGCLSFGKFRREFIFLPFLPSRSHLHPSRNPLLISIFKASLKVSSNFSFSHFCFYIVLPLLILTLCLHFLRPLVLALGSHIYSQKDLSQDP